MKQKRSLLEEAEILTNDIIKYLPKFFDDFKNWEYANGTSAGNDFKKIYNKAKSLNKKINESKNKL